MAILRIVSKGLKEPGDKLQLLKVLSLGQVIDALEQKTRQQQIERGNDTDEGEESYRESLGKLFNVFGLELCKLEVQNSHHKEGIPLIVLVGCTRRTSTLRGFELSVAMPSCLDTFHGGRIR